MIATEKPQDVPTVFANWVEEFEAALTTGDLAGLDPLFEDECYWKDILSFTWAYRTFHRLPEILDGLQESIESTGPHSFRVSSNRTVPRVVRRSAREVIEGFFDFETKVGHGTGFARLAYGGDGASSAPAWIVLTTLQSLHGSEERIDELRPTGLDYAMTFAGPNWLDMRRRSCAYRDHEPDVLVVGGGQAGLSLAARLVQFGIDALVVEKNPRIGDNWRNRYHSLTLHNEVWANGLPYMPFPPTWPTFVPKDMLAGWLEAYAEAMELNVWTGTELISASFDESSRCWHTKVRGPDGTRHLRVPHLALATGGASGVPHMPDLPGLARFEGEVIHSSAFPGGEAYAGRQAIVIGTGTSGHDVAQDLHANGAARVTMVQRSPTCVVNLVPSGTMVYAIYSEGPPAEDVDLITASMPYPVLRESLRWVTQKTCELDRPLLDRLAKAGFELDFGPDDTGFYMMYLRRGGRYYINVGCSELIAGGEIALVQARDIGSFTGRGLAMDDGKDVSADLVVLATGYDNQQESVRTLLGDEVAERVGPIWGFDENHNMRNMWQRTAQDRLWIMGGSLMDCRLHSRFLALQIKADLEGLLPPHPAGATLRHAFQRKR